ncbi:hypothetical protein B481_0028 [Planococcus halocryophilus Or1]|nr:hypothetical protein B481_0028 [Planococcus halocryophilus Or1]
MYNAGVIHIFPLAILIVFSFIRTPFSSTFMPLFSLYGF